MDKVPVPRQGEIMALQYGRAFAALIVCLFHTYGLSDAYFGPVSPGKIFNFGHSGVEFFFILSGFIIFVAHRRDIGQPDQLRTFAIKRIIRILPMFWLVVVPLGLVFLALPQFGDDRALTVTKFLMDIFLIPRSGTLTLSPAWTLQHEVVFYLFFATLLLNRTLGMIVIVAWQAVCLAVMLLALTPYNYLLPVNKFVGFFNFGFAVGLGIAIFYRSSHFERYKGLLKAGGALGLALLFGTMIGEWNMQDAFLGGSPMLHLAYFVIYALIILGMLSIEQKPRPTLDATLGLLGAASYVLYLTHEPVGSVVVKVLYLLGLKGRISPDVGYWTIILACVVVAVVVHVFIEKLVLEWLRHRLFPEKDVGKLTAAQPA